MLEAAVHQKGQAQKAWPSFIWNIVYRSVVGFLGRRRKPTLRILVRLTADYQSTIN
jgi:hypothetical protein